jgi:hypothetical protein
MAIQSNAADIHLRSSQAMNLSAQTPFSVTTWINATWNPGTTSSLVGIYGPPTDTPLGGPVTAMQIGTQTGTYDIVCWTWGGGLLVAGPAAAMTGFNGIWVFITYTFDGTTHRLYRNGVLLASSTNAQIPGYLNQVYINGYPGSITSEVASFQTDQYALYRRTLSADEVLTIYNAGGARHGINNGLICRYEYDELSQGINIASVPDLTGNNNTLTLVGAGTNMTYTYTNTLANSNIRPVQ